jgi:shikimate dehydrogenase
MTDRYAVFGHPIHHSKSPIIHALFARHTGQDLAYEAILAPLNGFAECVAQFRGRGGKGANITVPFKEQAFALCTQRTQRAERAGAVNTFKFENNAVMGDNTDGAGLVADLTRNLGFTLTDKHILLLGAGGAARGVMGPLLERAPARLVIANRTASRARDLAKQFQQYSTQTVEACGLEEVDQPFDLVINATSASLSGELPALSSHIFKPEALAYDMMYGNEATPFLKLARQHGAHIADGLGMLVEQAAEAFYFWRGIRPETQSVMATLRGAK